MKEQEFDTMGEAVASLMPNNENKHKLSDEEKQIEDMREMIKEMF